MCAKCSVWPASWKSARQSSAPPIGWITSTTRVRHLDRRAERARALLSAAARRRAGRSPARRGRCRGRRASPRARAASCRPGTPGPTRGARNRRAHVPALRLVERRRRPARGRACRPRSSYSCSVESRNARHCVGELVEPEAEARGRARRSSARRAARPPSRSTCDAPRAWSGFRCSSVSSFRALARAARACRGRARSPSSGGASGSGIVSPSTVASSVASSSASFSACSRVSLPR